MHKLAECGRKWERTMNNQLARAHMHRKQTQSLLLHTHTHLSKSTHPPLSLWPQLGFSLFLLSRLTVRGTVIYSALIRRTNTTHEALPWEDHTLKITPRWRITHPLHPNLILDQLTPLKSCKRVLQTVFRSVCVEGTSLLAWSVYPKEPCN